MLHLIYGIIGISVLLGISYLLSNNKKNISWKLVIKGLCLQILFAIFILKGDILSEYFAPLGWLKLLFTLVAEFFVIVLDFTNEGSKFIFGPLMSNVEDGGIGYIFAFQVLPTIVFFSSITSILYHYRILEYGVKFFSKIVTRVLHTSGTETISAIANVFIGHTESVLLIKPYIAKLTRSELFCVMVGGLATIAGGVMAAYIQILGDSYAINNGIDIHVGRIIFAEHLLGASIMAAPAALIISKILIPELDINTPKKNINMNIDIKYVNGIDAAANGAYIGIKLAVNIGGMLLAFIALLAMINYGLEWFGTITHINTISPHFSLRLEEILGLILAPIGYLIGIPSSDVFSFGSLLGIKIILNEFVAYSELSKLIAEGILQNKSIIMLTFGLCGFANIASIAIQIGGMGSLAPTRRGHIAQLGIKAVLGGTIANLLVATLAGAILSI